MLRERPALVPCLNFQLENTRTSAWDETEAIREKGISFPRRGKLSNLEIFKPSLGQSQWWGLFGVQCEDPSSQVRPGRVRWLLSPGELQIVPNRGKSTRHIIDEAL